MKLMAYYPKTLRGQARILEAVIASILIFITFSAAFYMLFSSENVFKQETVDLNKLAYNTLHRMAESGIIEKTIEAGNNRQLNLTLQELLPQGIYFHLTINNATNENQQVNGPFSNASTMEFENSGETASSSITYTSKKGHIYYLILKLTRAGSR